MPHKPNAQKDLKLPVMLHQNHFFTCISRIVFKRVKLFQNKNLITRNTRYRKRMHYIFIFEHLLVLWV